MGLILVGEQCRAFHHLPRQIVCVSACPPPKLSVKRSAEYTRPRLPLQKTTTIRVMMGLIPADSGTVRLGGLDPSTDPLKVRGQVGYLAEDQTMYGWMNPVGEVRFLTPFYPSWDTNLAQSCMDRFEIPRQTQIDRLSKGQAVKLGLALAMALAMAHRPPIVVLDDPSLGLDPIARKEFNRDLVEHLQSSGATVLYSSHLLDEVESVADAVAILDEGRVIRHGSTDAIRSDVKRILVSRDAVATMSPPDGLLDVRRHDDRLAIVVDHSEACIAQLSEKSIQRDVVDLSLDEIFEAFVIGRTHDWPSSQADVPVLALGSIIAAGVFWYSDGKPVSQMVYGIVMPQSLVIHWAYGDETGGYTDHELVSYRWISLALAVPFFAFIAKLFVHRYGSQSARNPQAKPRSFRMSLPTMTTRLLPRLPNRLAAMIWLELRQSVPLAAYGLAFAILMTVLGVLMEDHHRHGFGTSFRMELPHSMFVIGMLWLCFTPLSRSSQRFRRQCTWNPPTFTTIYFSQSVVRASTFASMVIRWCMALL